MEKSRLSLPEIKDVCFLTKFPIVFVIVGTLKTLIRLVDGFSLNPYFQMIKFSVYWYWLKESLRIGNANFKQ